MKNADLTEGQIVTLTPKGGRLFEVLRVDELSDNLVYADPVDGKTPAQWYGTDYARATDALTRQELVAHFVGLGVGIDSVEMGDLLDAHLGKSQDQVDRLSL